MTSSRKWLTLADDLVSLSRADECFVSVEHTFHELTRFAHSQIHQNVQEENIRIKILSAFGKKVGAVDWQGNPVKMPRMKKLVRASEEIAQHLPENPHFPSFAPAKKIRPRHLVSPSLQKWDAARRADTVRLFIHSCREVDLHCAGHISRSYHSLSLANSHHLRLFSDSLSLHFLLISYSTDSSGYAETTLYDTRNFSPERFSRNAVQKSLLGKNPRDLPPGEYPVLLDPYAVSDLLSFVAWLGLNARMHQELQSFLLGKEGQKVFSDSLTLIDDPFSKENPGYPFDGEGEEKRKWILIDRGVFSHPVHDRTTAKIAQTTSTGHGLLPPNEWGPFPTNLILQPGPDSPEHLLKKLHRGLWITRFHYSNVVDPRKGIITGMTRDGTFWVENGEVAYPVKNLRFTQDLQKALSSVLAVGNNPILCGEFFPITSPSLLLSSFSFSSATLF
ncbi:MAG: TldD/PmbA family protein [bacterium JZ-2024 1]